MNNLTQIKTTILGFLFLMIGIDYEFTKIIIEVEPPTNSLYFICSVVGGLGLLFAPDDIIQGIRNLIKKKTE